jgi:hypothetical protein
MLKQVEYMNPFDYFKLHGKHPKDAYECLALYELLNPEDSDDRDNRPGSHKNFYF